MLNRHLSSEQFKSLRAQPWFRELLDALIEEDCPQIIAYTPQVTPYDWAYSSGLREGYLMALSQFGAKNRDR